MSEIKKGIVGIIAVVLVVFTVVFLLNAYNKGDIGNKAEKVAEEFCEQLEGTWYGKGEISAITFGKDGESKLSILGMAVDGEYSDTYDIGFGKHTLKLKYQALGGVSVEREFIAKLDGDKLTLTDNKLQMVSLEFSRSEDATMKTIFNTTSAADATASADDETKKAQTSKTTEALKKSMLGEWKDSSGTNSGYEFREDSTVTIKLLGVSYDGSYEVTVDEGTGKNLVRITYAKLGMTKVTNGYFITVEDDVMTLVQRGAEKISLTFNKVK